MSEMANHIRFGRTPTYDDGRRVVMGDIVHHPNGKQYVVTESHADGTVSVEPYRAPYVAPPPNRHQRRAARAQARRAQ